MDKSTTRTPLPIGITCFPTYGGSGVVATEIGIGMAERGHRVHFICYDMPRRLGVFSDTIFFHEVVVRDYPLFEFPPYDLALASKMVDVSTYEQLDILHVHYAVPHATSAFLARQVLGEKSPKIITTLHGTDITLVGNDRSYLPVTRFSIAQSDGVTSPSQALKLPTYDKLNVSTTLPIEVIPNFVDTSLFAPPTNPEEYHRTHLPRSCQTAERILTHISNFRPAKRIDDVIRIFAKVNQSVPSHLFLVGDGPERSKAEALVRELGLTTKVCFIGKADSFVDLLQVTDVFLLPSETESFGLAALEAMSCGVPVVASKIHGLPEIVRHEETGFLAPVGAVDEMAAHAIRLLTDKPLWDKMSRAARTWVTANFDRNVLLDRFENYYYRILGI